MLSTSSLAFLLIDARCRWGGSHCLNFSNSLDSAKNYNFPKFIQA